MWTSPPTRRAFAQLQTVYGKETRANPAFDTQKTE